VQEQQKSIGDILPSSSIRVSRQQTSCTVEEDAVVLDTKHNFYYGLENVAARIWQLIQKPISFEQLVRSISEEYEVDSAQCAADSKVFLVELLKKDLITVDQLTNT